MDKEGLLKRLSVVEGLASASKLKRMLSMPFRYISAIVFREIIYKKKRKEKRVVCNTFFNSSMHLLLPSSTDIYLTGGKSHHSEIRLAKYLIQNLNKDETFIDVGGHYGYFTLLGSHRVGEGGEVFSFEASPNTYQILSKNCLPHQNIQCFHLAVSDVVGELEFYEFPNLYSEYNTLEIDQFKNEKWFSEYKPTLIQVKSVVLDDFISTHNINPKIIKIDVEGAEFNVINGMSNSLTKHSPIVIMEYLAAERFNNPHLKAESKLKSLGYKAHLIDDSGNLILLESVSNYFEQYEIESDNIVFCKD